MYVLIELVNFLSSSLILLLYKSLGLRMKVKENESVQLLLTLML